MMMIALAGSQVGTVVALAASGVLAAKVGWESVFYVFGAIGAVWTVLWMIFVRSAPANDPSITKAERCYIEQTLKRETKNPIKETPWKSILTSPAVWAIFFAQYAEAWGLYSLQTQLSLFLNDVFNYNVERNGVVSSLPYIALGVMLVVAGFIADSVEGKGILSKRNTRRIFISGGFMSQAILRVVVVYFLHPFVSVRLITLSLGLAGFSCAAMSVNFLEIAPQFSGIIVGLSKVLSCTTGIISPIVTGYIVTTPVSKTKKLIISFHSFYHKICILLHRQ